MFNRILELFETLRHRISWIRYRIKEEKEKKLLKDVIIYLVKKAQERGIKVDRIWLQKMIFLIQYYDTKTGKLTTRKKIFKTVSYIMYYR